MIVTDDSRANIPTAFSGSLSASGTAGSFSPQAGRPVYLTLTGTWAGTVQVEITRDGGTTWAPMTALGAAWARFTGNCDEMVDDPSTNAVTYRINFTRTSGTLTYRLGH